MGRVGLVAKGGNASGPDFESGVFEAYSGAGSRRETHRASTAQESASRNPQVLHKHYAIVVLQLTVHWTDKEVLDRDVCCDTATDDGVGSQIYQVVSGSCFFGSHSDESYGQG